MDILFCIAILLLFIFLLVLTKLYCELKEKIENIKSDFSHLDSRITHRSDAISDYLSDLSARVYINEEQILNIAKKSAEFFCTTNN